MKKKPSPIKPMSPATVRREWKALEYMYENLNAEIVTNEVYDTAKQRLIKALALWAEKLTHAGD